MAQQNDLHPCERDDNVHCPPHADENLNWNYENYPGWSRTTFDGHRWRYYGPLDEWGRKHLLAHFELDQPAIAALYPLGRLRVLPPFTLREIANGRATAQKSA